MEKSIVLGLLLLLGFLSFAFQKEVAAVSGDMFAVIGDVSFSIEGNPALSVAMAPGEFKDLVHICTVTTKGQGFMQYWILLAFSSAHKVSLELVGQITASGFLCMYSKLGNKTIIYCTKTRYLYELKIPIAMKYIDRF